MNKRGTLVVVSGFSGAGKGTLMCQLINRHDNYALSISATTRNPREGEVDGREYFFGTKEDFELLIANDNLIEYAQYVNHYYGTPRSYVEEQLNKGKDVILEIEIQGALKVKEKHPDTLLLFVVPPSIDELKNRLVMRGTECDEVIDSRIERAVEEAKGMKAYDYILVNDDVTTCVEQMHMVIQGAKSSVGNNGELISNIQEDLIKYINK